MSDVREPWEMQSIPPRPQVFTGKVTSTNLVAFLQGVVAIAQWGADLAMHCIRGQQRLKSYLDYLAQQIDEYREPSQQAIKALSVVEVKFEELLGRQATLDDIEGIAKQIIEAKVAIAMVRQMEAQVEEMRALLMLMTESVPKESTKLMAIVAIREKLDRRKTSRYPAASQSLLDAVDARSISEP